jgi:hypothetical protein
MPIGASNDGTAANNVSRTRGDKGGDTRLQSHTHPVALDPVDTRSQFSSADAGNAFGGGDGNVALTYWANGGTYREAQSRSSGSGAGENMPPFLVTNYIIKAVADIARGGWYTQSSPPVVTQLPTNPAIGEEVYLYSASPIAGYQRQRWDGSAWSILSDSRWQGTSASNFLTASSTTTAGYTGQSSITYTPASITLTPGIWLVRSMMSLINASTTDTAAVGIWNQTTGAFVSGSYGPSSYTTTSFGVSISSMMTRITVSSNTQVCPYGNRNGGSTISVFSGVGAPSGAITATRLFYS